MDLNVNIKVTVETSPVITKLINQWMLGMSQQQLEALEAFQATTLSTLDKRLSAVSPAALPAASAETKAAPPAKAEKPAEPKATAETKAAPPAQAEKPAEPEAAAEAAPATEKNKAEPMTAEETEELQQMARAFIRAGEDNRKLLKDWLGANGFERVSAVTRDKVGALKEVLKVA